MSFLSSLLALFSRYSRGFTATTRTGTMGWTYRVDGLDLVVENVTATCFGGAFDAGDNGQTESGWKNNGDGSTESSTAQCALPIRSTEAATRNSPLAFKGPHIPWFTVVKVWRDSDGEQTAIKCILSDNGPDYSRFPTHAIDLNPPAVQALGTSIPLKQLANKWSEDRISYRIVDAARYIS